MNGTFIDGERIPKGARVRLLAGSEISFLPPKENMSFIFRMKKEAVSADGGLGEQYTLGDTLGTGAFATVKLGINNSTGERVAVKVIDRRRISRIDNSAKTGRRGRLDEEIHILRKANHRNVIGTKDVRAELLLAYWP